MPIWPKLLPAGRLPPISGTYLLPPPAAATTITMKALPNLKPAARAIDIFSRVFPHRLKFQSFLRFSVGSSSVRQQQQVRALSTRGRRIGSGSGGGGGGGGFVRAGAAGSGSRSLIEDEADLSDWVSGLNSKSFNKTQLYSDDSDDDRGRGRSTGSSRNRMEERGGGKRRREESDFSDFRADSDRRGGTRGSSGSFPRRKESGFDNFGSANRRGGQRGMESNDRFSRGSRGREAGGGGNNVFGRNNGRDDSKIGSLRGRDIAIGGRSMGSRVRPGRGGNHQGREGSGMELGRSSKRNSTGRGRFVSDEDEEEEDLGEDKRGYVRFKELIDSEESSEVDDDGSDDEVVDDAFEEESVFSQARSGDFTVMRASPSSSAEGNDSYLSETRSSYHYIVVYSCGSVFCLLCYLVLVI